MLVNSCDNPAGSRAIKPPEVTSRVRFGRMWRTNTAIETVGRLFEIRPKDKQVCYCCQRTTPDTNNTRHPKCAERRMTSPAPQRHDRLTY